MTGAIVNPGGISERLHQILLQLGLVLLLGGGQQLLQPLRHLLAHLASPIPVGLVPEPLRLLQRRMLLHQLFQRIEDAQQLAHHLRLVHLVRGLDALDRRAGAIDEPNQIVVGARFLPLGQIEYVLHPFRSRRLFT